MFPPLIHRYLWSGPRSAAWRGYWTTIRCGFPSGQIGGIMGACPELTRQRTPIRPGLRTYDSVDARTITKTMPMAVRPNETAISGSNTSITALAP